MNFICRTLFTHTNGGLCLTEFLNHREYPRGALQRLPILDAHRLPLLQTSQAATHTTAILPRLRTPHNAVNTTAAQIPQILQANRQQDCRRRLLYIERVLITPPQTPHKGAAG